MRQPPRGKQDPLFSRAFSLRLAWQGAMVGGLTLLAYGLGLRLTHDYAIANTMAFATLTLSQLFHAFDVRSEETSLFRLGFFSNPAMNKAFLAGGGAPGPGAPAAAPPGGFLRGPHAPAPVGDRPGAGGDAVGGL